MDLAILSGAVSLNSARTGEALSSPNLSSPNFQPNFARYRHRIQSNRFSFANGLLSSPVCKSRLILQQVVTLPTAKHENSILLVESTLLLFGIVRHVINNQCANSLAEIDP